MSTPQARPVPQPTPYSQAFWDATAEGRLVIQQCGDCSAYTMYAKLFCPQCMSDDMRWAEATGKGEVYTFTVQERGGPSGFADRMPYVLAVIRLDEGVQIMSNIVGDDAAEVACGDRVTVAFERMSEGDFVLPVFQRDASGS
jgi:uncharacterized OB-fold protein